MDNVALGKAGLKGWRAKIADAVASPVAKRSRFSEDQVRAVVGALFVLVSVVYLAGAVRRVVVRT